MGQKDKRFVIQEHTKGKDIHWELMLEKGNALQTYRLDRSPEELLYRAADVTKIHNHPCSWLSPTNQHFVVIFLSKS